MYGNWSVPPSIATAVSGVDTGSGDDEFTADNFLSLVKGINQVSAASPFSLASAICDRALSASASNFSSRSTQVSIVTLGF